MEPSVRRAGRRDLPELTRWVERNLERECRRDPLLRRGPGRAEPYLAGLLASPRARVAVLEVEGRMAGYLVAGLERFSGPAPPRTLLDRILRRPGPPPLFAPVRILWVQDVAIDRRGRRADGARRLARWVAEWARESRVERVAGMVSRDNLPARAFASALGFEPRREIWSRDIEEPGNPPPLPERPGRGPLS